MKRLHLISITLLLGLLKLSAQYQITEPEQHTVEENQQKYYLGVGSGINSNCGLAGLLVEIPLQKGFSANGGVGLGAWGFKTAIGLRYHPNYPYQVYYGLSFTSASGAANVPIDLYTVQSGENDTEKVIMDLERANNIALAVGYDVRMGRVARLNLEVGYSVALGSERYTVKDSTVELTKMSKNMMQFMTPGGLILGLGVTFSIGG